MTNTTSAPRDFTIRILNPEGQLTVARPNGHVAYEGREWHIAGLSPAFPGLEGREIDTLILHRREVGDSLTCRHNVPTTHVVVYSANNPFVIREYEAVEPYQQSA